MNHSQAIETKLPMRYVLGELTNGDRDAFEEHLADCSNCMDEVWMATKFAANAREVFRTSPPERAAWWHQWLEWRPFPAFAFSAALNVVLAVGLGYGVLHVYPGLRSEIAELNASGVVDVVPVHAVVRDASAAAQVVKAAGNLTVLSFDIPQRYRRYTYVIADTSGRVVSSGNVEDRGGISLNLRVPAGLAAGEYRVTAAGINGDQREELGTCLLQVARR